MRAPILFLAFCSASLVASGVEACPVCYGEHNASPIFEGAEAAMLFLLGFTYSLICGGVFGFLRLRRKQRRHIEASGSA